MKTQLCTRQICFILIAFSAAGKLLMLPAQLAYYAKNDLWVSLIISFALQTAAVWSAAYLSSKTQENIFTLVKNTFGNTVSKIFAFLFALFFIAAAFLPIYEQKLFVHRIFYDTIPALIVFLPFFIISVYVGCKGLNNAGRAADIVLPLFLAALAAVLVMSVTEANAQWLLPAFSNPAKNVFKGAYSTLYNFTDGAVILMFTGRFNYKRGDCTKITISYALGAIVVITFVTIFYAVFSTLSPDRYFAISDTAIFFPALSVTGRVDLLGVYVIEIAMLFGIMLYIQLAVECLGAAFGGRVKAVPLSFIVNAVLLILLLAFNERYKILQTFYGGVMCYVFALFSLVLPCAAWLLRRRKGDEE